MPDYLPLHLLLKADCSVALGLGLLEKPSHVEEFQAYVLFPSPLKLEI